MDGDALLTAVTSRGSSSARAGEGLGAVRARRATRASGDAREDSCGGYFEAPVRAMRDAGRARARGAFERG